MLPLLLLVVCPAAMFFMMRGMHGQGREKTEAGATQSPGTLTSAELRRLKNDLEARLDEIDARLESTEMNAATHPFRTNRS